MKSSRQRVRGVVVGLPLWLMLAGLAGCGAERAADRGTDPSPAPSSQSAAESPTAGEASGTPYASDEVVASVAVTGGICGTQCDEETAVLGDHTWNRSSGAGEEFGELDEAEWQTLLAALEMTALDETSLKERDCPGVADYRTVTYSWTADDTTAEVVVCDLAAPADDPLVEWWGSLLASR